MKHFLNNLSFFSVKVKINFKVGSKKERYTLYFMIILFYFYTFLLLYFIYIRGAMRLETFVTIWFGLSRPCFSRWASRYFLQLCLWFVDFICHHSPLLRIKSIILKLCCNNWFFVMYNIYLPSEILFKNDRMTGLNSKMAEFCLIKYFVLIYYPIRLRRIRVRAGRIWMNERQTLEFQPEDKEYAI